MSHFWLKPDEQTLMDSATSTVSDYGYIGAFDLGTNTKTALKKLLGYEAKPEDQIRPYKLIRHTRFLVTAAKSHMNAKVLVRISKAQALMLKMAHQPDSLIARLLDDPTGEYWGNLLISQMHLPHRGVPNYPAGFSARWHVGSEMRSLLNNEGFGPTLDRVSTYADALPEDWRPAFVWERFSDWSRSHSPYNFFNRQRGQFKLETKADENSLFNGIFEAPMTKCGQAWATDFWRECQSALFRSRFGLA